MALIKCPECKKMVSETADSCPKCGWHLTPENVLNIKEQQKKRGIGCLVIVAIFVALMIFANKNEPSNPAHAVVENSQWDGSVRQVKDWLKEHVRDPDSLEYVEWSPLVKNGDGYTVRVKYRAKNGFGGYEVEERVFSLDQAGNVTYVSEPSTY
jgi:hypothetical protein